MTKTNGFFVYLRDSAWEAIVLLGTVTPKSEINPALNLFNTRFTANFLTVVYRSVENDNKAFTAARKQTIANLWNSPKLDAH